MFTPLVPTDEAERLGVLRDLGVLDIAPDTDLDRIARIAATVCATPMSAVTLVDERRQVYKARVGVPLPEIARESGFCAHAILKPDQLHEVPDTAKVPWFQNRPFGGTSLPVRFYAAVPLKLREGSAIGTLCVMDHIPRILSEQQRACLTQLAQTAASLLETRRQLRVAVQVDRLTGLPNWFHFEKCFQATKARRGVLAFVRLKTVSQINSAHGFRVADALIKQTAERLRNFCGEPALVGRVKRGLFILFFPEMGASDFSRNAAPTLTGRLNAPYPVGELALMCPVNLGFASFPRDGRTLDEVVNAADAALQLAIERDESVAFFDRSVDNTQSVHYRLEPQLRLALAEGQFINHYQPKIDMATGRIVGLEALIRWTHPQRGIVPPSEFVPALESTGLIREVGSHILKRAVHDWLIWRRQRLNPPPIAVNVASAQLRSDSFLAELRQALAQAGGRPGVLAIEVTESVLIGDMNHAIDVLRQVRELGVPVAIDDFGTGYSSLAYIASLPIDEVKIDRSFVREMGCGKAYLGIVETCIALAHNLGLKVVAEGVEHEEQARMLKALHCDLAQGFFYSPPVPAADLGRLLEQRRARRKPRASA